MMKRLLWCLMLSFAGLALLTADDTKTVFEERTEVLKWGIDSQIIDLLGVLSQEKDPAYDEVVFDTLMESRNPEIQEKIIYYLMDREYKPLAEFTRNYCRFPLEDQDYNEKVLFAAVASLGHLKDTSSATVLQDLAFLDIPGITGPTTRALAALGDTTGAEKFLHRLEELDLTDPKDSIPGEIILFLGEVKYKPAASFLMGVVESEENYSINRHYACIALGQIGDGEAVEVLKTLYYESKNSIMRSYALAGLGYFNSPEVEHILLDALKRDSFWKVRVSAAERIGSQKISSAEKLLIYKAEKDPVSQVRIAAMKALGEMDTPEGLKFLSDFYADKKNPDNLRLEAFRILLKGKKLFLLDALRIVFDKEWESKHSRLLEFSSKEMSTTDWPLLGEFYKKMLTHKNPVIQTYGIRGIRRNNLFLLFPEAQALDREGESGMVRKEAKMLSPDKKEGSE